MKKYDQWMDEISREQKKKARDPRTNPTIDNKYKLLIRKQEQFLRGKFSFLPDLINRIYRLIPSGLLSSPEFSRRFKSGIKNA